MPTIRFTRQPKLPRDLAHLGYQAGQVVSVTDNEAQRWLNRGVAVVVTADPDPVPASAPAAPAPRGRRGKPADPAVTERSKYERVWAHPQYRTSSPGERIVDQAVQLFNAPAGATLIDWGMGCGRAAAKLEALGFKVTGIDIAENCRDEGVTVPLVVAPIWAPPSDFIAADYAFCTDVLEHLPPDKVDASLDVIRQCTRVAAFFQVGCFPDSYGDIVGEDLHLTVQPVAWWQEKLAARWTTVEHGGPEERPYFFCRV
jgi:hypothetical protein